MKAINKKITVTAYLLTIAIVLGIYGSFSWFYLNNRSKLNGESVTGESKKATVTFQVLNNNNNLTRENAISSEDPNNWKDLSTEKVDFLLEEPGSYSFLLVRVENTGTTTLIVDEIGFLSAYNGDVNGENDEVPRIIKNTSTGKENYYFLGTQLRSQFIKANGSTSITPSTLPEAVKLKNNNEILNEEPAMKLFSSTNTNAVINAGESMIFLFEISFINDISNSQNVYKNFGKDITTLLYANAEENLVSFKDANGVTHTSTAGKCTRSLYVKY